MWLGKAVTVPECLTCASSVLQTVCDKVGVGSRLQLCLCLCRLPLSTDLQEFWVGHPSSLCITTVWEQQRQRPADKTQGQGLDFQWILVSALIQDLATQLFPLHPTPVPWTPPSTSFSLLLKICRVFKKNFIHEYCICFIYTPCSPSSISCGNPFSLNFKLFNFIFIHISPNLCWPCIPGGVAFQWSMIDVSRATPLRKTDFPSLSSYQLSIDSWLGVGTV